MPPRRPVVPLLVILLLLWVSALPTLACEYFTGPVIALADGDTLTVLRGTTPVRVRLHGVDAPERAQPFGTRARQFTSELAFQQMVTVIVHNRDRYGRTVGEVLLPDGRHLGRELVREGWAWWTKQYAPQDTLLAHLEEAARVEHRGLWSDPAPIAPWHWRQGKR